MEYRNLGPNGPRVSALGLGCMGMSHAYGPSDEAASIATIHAAQEAGITWLDTGDFYGMGHNEMLLREALKGGRRDRVFLAVKFGAQRDPTGAFIGFDTRPAAIKTALAYTLQRLGTDHIDLYQPARLDPAVPIEETVGAIADLVAAGYVRHIGLSEMGPATIRRAHATHPIVALQIEYSLMSRAPEAEILPVLEELGIALNPYGVLSRGLLGGSLPAGRGDFRTHSPRFQGENLARNRKLAEALAAFAAERGATAVQMAFAWALAKGKHVVPLVGARTPARLQEALGALELRLTPEDIAALEAAVPAEAVAGTRYPAEHMGSLDSERRTAA
ncbi:aldo/keto reductase [Falsiroseomonas tokyonensis]|uniref:Aldo/keto reductase n=1 Tax=Falsiroseomonas tokyonensis TaxID=430521 RepID=A0ABV7BNN8_9PROT|nr:aldo/keto reductase [Falsiroseomonas tokyonensis]MBU8536249.1 aldo/keto reductase [Falsiroseomonas tokyonensis]